MRAITLAAIFILLTSNLVVAQSFTTDKEAVERIVGRWDVFSDIYEFTNELAFVRDLEPGIPLNYYRIEPDRMAYSIVSQGRTHLFVLTSEDSRESTLFSLTWTSDESLSLKTRDGKTLEAKRTLQRRELADIEAMNSLAGRWVLDLTPKSTDDHLIWTFGTRPVQVTADGVWQLTRYDVFVELEGEEFTELGMKTFSVFVKEDESSLVLSQGDSGDSELVISDCTFTADSFSCNSSYPVTGKRYVSPSRTTSRCTIYDSSGNSIGFLAGSDVYSTSRIGFFNGADLYSAGPSSSGRVGFIHSGEIYDSGSNRVGFTQGQQIYDSRSNRVGQSSCGSLEAGAALLLLFGGRF